MNSLPHRMFRQHVGVCLLALLGLAVSGCEDRWTAVAQESRRSRQRGTPSAKPVPEEYRVLAEQLGAEIHPSWKDYRDDMEMSELFAEIHQGILALRGIRSADEDIVYLAEQGVEALQEGLTRFKRLLELPKPPSFGEVMLQSAIAGFLSPDPLSGAAAGGAIGMEADASHQAVQDEAQRIFRLIDQCRALERVLPAIAQKYSATHSDPDGRIQVTIREAWGESDVDDWLVLSNTGEALDDCTIQVTLKGTDGSTQANVHFVKHWPSGGTQVARYEPGFIDATGQARLKTTVDDIAEAEISLWSPGYATSFTYVYRGEERDRVIAELCQDLSLSAAYQPFETGFFANTQRGARVQLKGVGGLPKCRVQITFRNGTRSPSWFWEPDSWTSGEIKTFSTPAGALTSDPSELDILLTIPDSTYQYRITVTVGP